MANKSLPVLIFTVLAFTSSSTSSFADEIKPFSSDGCSAFPDGTLAHNTLWLACCTEHDRAYWQGGSYDERLIADQELKSCVEQIGEPEIALLMLAGVRVGGTPFLPTQFRWGYGWSYPKFYGVLSTQESEQVQQAMKVKTDESITLK